MLAMFVFATAATADTITGQGTLTGTRYRGGVSSNGGVSFAAGVQVNRDPAGEITHVRAAARITKLSKVTSVQVDRVALGTSAGAVVTNGAPKNSGAASQIYSYTAWRGVAPRTCTDYRVRADYSIRWTDGAISKFSVLSSLTRVCGPTNPPVYANCTAMTRSSRTAWVEPGPRITRPARRSPPSTSAPGSTTATPNPTRQGRHRLREGLTLQ